MKGDREKFANLSEIYAQFSQENKENLMKIAKNLLRQQKKDIALVDAVSPKKSGKKNGK